MFQYLLLCFSFTGMVQASIGDTDIIGEEGKKEELSTQQSFWGGDKSISA